MAYSNKPKALDTLLKEYLKRMPQRTQMKRGMILHLWPKIVGGQVARATKNLSFEQDKLIVHVENDVWRHELHQNRFSIAKKLNSEVGSNVVKEIVVRC